MSEQHIIWVAKAIGVLATIATAAILARYFGAAGMPSPLISAGKDIVK